MNRHPVPLLITILLFSLVFPAVRPLWGAEIVEIEIHHVQGRITASGAIDCCGPTGKRIDASPTLRARKNSEVHISIVDPNPLLFESSLKKGDATQTVNAKALGTFTDSLDALVKGLEGTLTSAKAAKISAAAAQKQHLVAVQQAAKVGKPAPPPPPALIECDMEVDNLLKVGNTLNQRIKERATVTNQSLTDHAGAKAAVTSWQLDALSKSLQQADDDLLALAGKLLASPRSPALDECRGVVALARTTLPSLSKALADLKDFKSLVDQIDVPIVLAPFTVNISEDQVIKLSIKPSANFPASLSKTTLWTGDTTFTVSPFSRVAITAGAAAVYSFVRSPTFSAVSSGSQFVIKQTKNDYNKLDGVVAMQIEPDAWDLGPLNVGVQIGVSPKTDLGLYLGLSLRATGFFTLGAGVAFQRVDQLAPGLALGQTIATQDLLKTEKTFRSGLYLHMTVTTQKRPQ